MMFARRPHGTYRIIDTTRYTVVFGSAYVCDGSHRDFRIEWFRRDPMKRKRHGITVPTLKWYRAYKLRRFGGLLVWRLQSWALRQLAIGKKKVTA